MAKSLNLHIIIIIFIIIIVTMLLFTAAISLQNKASTTTNQLSCPKGLGDTSLRTPLEINLSLILAQLRRHLCTVCLVAIELLLKPSS